MTIPKKTLTPEPVLTQYKTGPEAHLRRCIICHENIETGDRWLKMTWPGQYSVGAHASCLARQGHKLDGGAIVATRTI